MGTKSFSEKKKIIKENSKANILNKEVLSADRWNEDSILNRARILADMLIKEFEYVDIHSGTESNTGLSFTINSGIDFTDTKPDGFSFVGEYTKVTSWADLLSKFIAVAYELDTNLISELAKSNYSIPNASRIYITNDERQLRKSRQIDNSGIE